MSDTKPLKVVIDARMVRGKMHGIARHVLLLACGFHELQERGELQIEPIFLVERDSAPKNAFFAFRTFEVKAKFLSLIELVDIPRAIGAIRPDLYHSPSFSSLAVCPVPHIVTVHDLNHLRFGSRLKKLYYRRLLKPFCKTARKVLTVSQFTQDELAKWLRLKNEKIQIVPNAIDFVWTEVSSPDAVSETAERYGLKPGKYFLALNSDKSHKNLDLLCNAYAAYRNKMGENAASSLALVGGGLNRVQPGVVALPSLDDATLRDLMRGAGAFLFPSLYEGFGFPPVEAFVAGARRVILSDIPPHRESLGQVQERVQFVDPTKEKDWILALANASQENLNTPQDSESVKKILTRLSAQAMAEVHQSLYLESVK